MKLDPNFFVKQNYIEAELAKYKKSAKRDLDIAKGSKEVEVRFHFVFMALIKTGIYVLAKSGHRVKSRPGHHVKIIEAMSLLMNFEEIQIIGDKMRKDRNLDLYSGDDYYSEQDVNEYIKFVEKLYLKA